MCSQNILWNRVDSIYYTIFVRIILSSLWISDLRNDEKECFPNRSSFPHVIIPVAKGISIIIRKIVKNWLSRITCEVWQNAPLAIENTDNEGRSIEKE